MKLFKKISIILFLSFIIYILFLGNSIKSYATGYISLEEAEQKMPGLAERVNSLKANHPNYNFQFYETGLDWNTSILREYQGHGYSPVNLFNFNSKYSGMWYCPVCGTKVYDNGTLSCASQEAIRYMMDPRNSLTEESVFQFKSLETPDASYDDIARACIGTFLNNGECVQAILEASQAYNVNAFYLVAKIITEQGKNGTTLSNGVVVNGTTYYNLFNIGAYGSKTQIIANGANYAASQGWNSRRASIIGGAQTVKNNYIGKGQNTCYYQKYNLVNVQSGLFKHQYAQNILAAENEGRKFREYYNINGTIIGNHTFIIPIFSSSMPATASGRPSTATKNTITYETGRITANGGVKVRSYIGTNSEQIGTIPQNATVKILYRCDVEASGYFWDLVISDTDGTYGYVARNYVQVTGSASNSGANSDTEYVEPVSSQASSGIIDTNTNIMDDKSGQKYIVYANSIEFSSNFSFDDIKSTFNNPVMLNTAGEITTQVCTGNRIQIDGREYTVIKKGDVNGDGEIDVSDVVIMLNHIKNKNLIQQEASFNAARISGDNEISVTDVVRELNYIKKKLNEILVK